MLIPRKLLVAALCIAQTLAAKDLTLTSTISSVKVFLSGAEVTRSAKVGLPTGPSTLLFSGLSAEVDATSLQVTGQGAFTILGVRHRLDQADQRPTQQEVKNAQAHVKAIDAEIAK
jgi:hypothetical protein